ncbi:MAG: glycosyltransferase domain-containing protein, partial [Puniceicoccales bacterium]
KETGGRPVVVHGHGNHDLKPIFTAVQEAFFEREHDSVDAGTEVSLFTCNNGHESLGLLEETAGRLGVPVQVFGQDRQEWSNAEDKPQVILEALDTIGTEYVLYADSRDCILLDSPQRALNQLRKCFADKQLVFGADIVNWPPVLEFQRYEKRLAGPDCGRYRFLNGGCWMGKTRFCREFFTEVLKMEPAREAPDSEQGLLKRLLPRYADEVALDYGTDLFFNCGFVAGDLIAFE